MVDCWLLASMGTRMTTSCSSSAPYLVHMPLRA
eukprot:CAMPEP_0202867270 /NCGR_PEP_ID=MMETSP1391-20130828/9061_1 /ASSEMBLY_ACC=CAM_ASM_000867 /TAXON_ID=1034604 /ORGANISM="Chlamydomonas leiostraca, Strain SAG 11-49" /LENGTH=32 /DNA_ID= /DNA_START= /DNA_END= /DNA_ORIENTATION=